MGHSDRLEVSAGFNEDSANFDFDMIRILLTDAHKLALWVPPFVLAVVLRIITHKFQHQLIFPLCKRLF
jgi:SulP family sulfate permease